ncbi:MAG: SPOR domain-containing protein [Chitinophagales bacterium]|nr:SPOR domain-containing protein [Chitinophagales bacterium]
MKKLFFILSIFSILISKSMFAKTIINGDYSFLQEITFQLYDDNVPPYKIPVRLKTLEETLMFEVLHATQKDKNWVAYTMNKSLLGTFKVGQPALLEVGDVKKMYFVAGFPNSVGGLDLYVSEFKDGKWSKPSNLGKGINTINNESNPGLLNDHTLTYSSNGIIKKLDLKTLKVEDADGQAVVTSNVPTSTPIKEEVKVVTQVQQPVVVKDKVAEKISETNTTNNTQTIVNNKNQEITEPVVNQTKNDAGNISAIGDNSTATPVNTDDVSAIGDNSTATPISTNAGSAMQQVQTKKEETYANAEVAPKQKIQSTPQQNKFIEQNATQNNAVQPVATVNGNVKSYGSKTQAEMLATFGNAIQLGAFGNPNWSLINQFSSIGNLITYKNEKGLNVVWITGFANRAAADAALSQVHTKAGFGNAIALGK